MAAVSHTVGAYTNTFLRKVFWGPRCLDKSLPEAMELLSKNKKALIITGASLANKTDVVRDVERALGDGHVGTFANIRQHAPVADIRAVVKALRDKEADVLVGG